MIIGTTTLGESTNTMGLEIISLELQNAGYNTVSVNESNAKDVDILMVSLFWIDQVLRFPRWLINAKINPKEKKPLIIIGGSMAFNMYPLIDMFHYAVLGDGENVAVELVGLIKNGEYAKIEQLDYIITKEKILSNQIIRANYCNQLPIRHYVEQRTNKITRVEIARGCKMQCAFCQLSAIKPYIEIPPVVLKRLIMTSPTKNIALFCPDRGSYSGYLNIEAWCAKYGKRNMGTDIRLASAAKQTIATQIRFGLEGFSERERKYIKKPYKDQKVIDDVYHIFKTMRTPKGNPITVITWYMILGLLGQSENDYVEFANMLCGLDERCSGIGHRLTIFLANNDFNPYPHTILGSDRKDIHTDHFALWKKVEPKLKNITIADHGGTNPRPLRLMRLLATRGHLNSNIALYNISIRYSGAIHARDERSYQTIVRALNKSGVDVDALIEGTYAQQIAAQFLPHKINLHAQSGDRQEK